MNNGLTKQVRIIEKDDGYYVTNEENPFKKHNTQPFQTYDEAFDFIIGNGLLLNNG